MEMLKLFKMLSDQTRVRIMMLLFQGSLCVCELEEILSITQVNVSRHLMKLKENNIVKTKRTSRRIYYYLNDNIKDNKGFKDFAVTSIKTEKILIADKKRYQEHLKNVSNEYYCTDLKKEGEASGG